MNEYILLMHGDAIDRAVADNGESWGQYLSTLRESGCFDGGSSIGAGQRLKKNQPAEPAETRVTGFIQVRAESLEAAKRFLVGNPVYEAGGTVELSELPPG